MTLFERKLLRIAKELAEEYLSDETIKKIVAKDSNFLDNLIEKDVEETLMMKRGDLEFLHASFVDRKPYKIDVKLPIEYWIVNDPTAFQRNFFKDIPALLNAKGFEIEEMSYKSSTQFYEDQPQLKIHAVMKPKPKRGVEKQIAIKYEYDTEADVSGLKIDISYTSGMERYVSRIAEMIGAKIGPLKISQKS